MIQYKSKNPYWSTGKLWKKMLTIPTEFACLSFEDYQYIIGDKIYKEASIDAEEAFRAVVMWGQLKR